MHRQRALHLRDLVDETGLDRALEARRAEAVSS
jgi:hypothetical protein